MTGFIFASGHLFMAASTAQSIGWPPSPFQREVGLANLVYGVLGVTSPFFEREYWLAAVIAVTIFLGGAAVGHVVEIVRSHNRSPGNAGYVLWMDIIIPTLAITLWVLYA